MRLIGPNLTVARKIAEMHDPLKGISPEAKIPPEIKPTEQSRKRICVQKSAAGKTNKTEKGAITLQQINETTYSFDNGKVHHIMRVCSFPSSNAFKPLNCTQQCGDVVKGLRRVEPYYYMFEVYSKGRWFGRTVLDVFTEEFSAHSKSYYVRASNPRTPSSPAFCPSTFINQNPPPTNLYHVTCSNTSVWDLLCSQEHAIEKGTILVSGQRTRADVRLKEHDVLSHRIHRHEPPVTSGPIKIIAQSDDIVVIDKPASIPVPCQQHTFPFHLLSCKSSVIKYSFSLKGSSVWAIQAQYSSLHLGQRTQSYQLILYIE